MKMDKLDLIYPPILVIMGVVGLIIGIKDDNVLGGVIWFICFVLVALGNFYYIIKNPNAKYKKYQKNN